MTAALDDDLFSPNVELHALIAGPYPPMTGQLAGKWLGPADGWPVLQSIEDSQHAGVNRFVQCVELCCGFGSQIDFSHRSIVSPR